LFQAAAEGGDPKALLNLAQTYYSARGVEHDPVLAYMWLEVAASRGEDVDEPKRVAASALSSSEIVEAERRASEWENLHRVSLGIPLVVSTFGVNHP